MVFADWTVSGDGSAALDASIKYAGTSSCKVTHNNASYATVYVTHDTFSEPQAQVVFWTYKAGGAGRPYPTGIEHSSYGAVDTGQTAYSTWEKFRATFWYDAGANTKWGRMEKWDGAAWNIVGSDTNFGSGSPSAGSIKLKSVSNFYPNGYTYFDELEVST